MKSCPKKRYIENIEINEPIAKNGICTDDSYDAYQLRSLMVKI